MWWGGRDRSYGTYGTYVQRLAAGGDAEDLQGVVFAEQGGLPLVAREGLGVDFDQKGLGREVEFLQELCDGIGGGVAVGAV